MCSEGSLRAAQLKKGKPGASVLRTSRRTWSSPGESGMTAVTEKVPERQSVWGCLIQGRHYLPISKMEDRQGAEGKELWRDGEAEAPGKVFPTSQRERSVASFSLLPQRGPSDSRG